MARNATLDLARLVAAIGIVLFHSGAPGAALGYAALPFFMMLLLLLAFDSAAAQGFVPYARQRVLRLLGPWLVWSAIYGAFKLTEILVTHKDPASEFAWWMLATGPALHLWFLPFAFAASLIVWPVARLSPVKDAVPPGGAGFAALVLVFAALALAAIGWQQGPARPIPLAQWLSVLPAVIFGLALGLVRNGRGQNAAGQNNGNQNNGGQNIGNQNRGTIDTGRGLALLLAAWAVTLAAWALGWGGTALPFCLAATLLLLCLAMVTRPGRWSDLAARTAMGVYLVHPLVTSVLRRITTLPDTTLTFFGLTVAGSLALAVLIWGRRSRPPARPAPA